MLRAVIIAFSTYSKIPTPRFTWKREDMKYVMCAFPMVGVVIAIVQYVCYVMLTNFKIGYVLTAAVMTLIPLIMTGGIHMDGYMDTMDALSSYGDKDKKLAILKDPHVGAFAVIRCVGYIMLTFALWHELVLRIDEGDAEPAVLYMVLSGFVLSRILSGLFAVIFRKAKRDGMLYDITGTDEACTDNVNNKRRTILLSELMIFMLCILYYFRLGALVLILPAALVSVCYRYMSYGKFGGTTGDLAGWFLQVTELTILLMCVIYICVSF